MEPTKLKDTFPGLARLDVKVMSCTDKQMEGGNYSFFPGSPCDFRFAESADPRIRDFDYTHLVQSAYDKRVPWSITGHKEDGQWEITFKLTLRWL